MSAQEPKIYTYTYTLRALGDIWTGDVDGTPRRTIPAGVLGSIRWWCEVVVRGLGGNACDPTRDGVRCPPGSTEGPRESGRHCVVCELFGCTGWARKFRFEVLDQSGQAKISQIKENDIFQLRFTELRPICLQEWALLDVTVRLIAEYGAIGGRTVYKPTEEPSRETCRHHLDYGLVKVESSPALDLTKRSVERDLRAYVQEKRWRVLNQDDFAWASLGNFWCVKGRYLARQNVSASTFNKALGRDEPKKRSSRSPSGNVDKWLAGGPQESKKIFSFKNPPEARRTYGFVRPPLIVLDRMRERLRSTWPDFEDAEFLTGSQILKVLLSSSSANVANV